MASECVLHAVVGLPAGNSRRTEYSSVLLPHFTLTQYMVTVCERMCSLSRLFSHRVALFCTLRTISSSLDPSRSRSSVNSSSPLQGGGHWRGAAEAGAGLGGVPHTVPPHQRRGGPRPGRHCRVSGIQCHRGPPAAPDRRHLCCCRCRPRLSSQLLPATSPKPYHAPAAILRCPTEQGT